MDPFWQAYVFFLCGSTTMVVFACCLKAVSWLRYSLRTSGLVWFFLVQPTKNWQALLHKTPRVLPMICWVYWFSTPKAHLGPAHHGNFCSCVFRIHLFWDVLLWWNEGQFPSSGSLTSGKALERWLCETHHPIWKKKLRAIVYWDVSVFFWGSLCGFGFSLLRFRCST